MEFLPKNWIFLLVIFCSLWALFVSGVTLIEELGEIKVKSSLPAEERSNFSEAPVGNKVDAITCVLNFALPLALGGLFFLVMNFRTNATGLGSLVIAICFFLVAFSKTMDAAEHIEVRTPTSLNARIWWM